MCGLPKAAVENRSIPTPQQSISGSGYTPTQELSDNNSAYGNSSQYLGSATGSSLAVGSTAPLTLTHTNSGLSQADQSTALVPDANTLPLSQEALAAMNTMNMSMDGLLWDPSIYPASFPTPWFDAPKGAAELYQPVQEAPAWLPPLNGYFTSGTGYIGGHLDGFNGMGFPMPQMPDVFSAVQPPTMPIQPSADSAVSDNPPATPSKPHKAWGVDIARPPVQLSLNKPASAVEIDDGGEDESKNPTAVVVGPDGPFPPGMSLARVAQAAHSEFHSLTRGLFLLAAECFRTSLGVIRLEVLHRSATLALCKINPRSCCSSIGTDIVHDYRRERASQVAAFLRLREFVTIEHAIRVSFSSIPILAGSLERSILFLATVSGSAGFLVLRHRGKSAIRRARGAYDQRQGHFGRS